MNKNKKKTNFYLSNMNERRKQKKKQQATNQSIEGKLVLKIIKEIELTT